VRPVLEFTLVFFLVKLHSCTNHIIRNRILLVATAVQQKNFDEILVKA
jgi:hypothetical protein